MIKTKNLTYTYPGDNIPTLKDCNLKIDEKSTVGIIGPSGCGKSTLLLAISGLIPHGIHGKIQGTVEILGKKTINSTIAELSQKIQILFQSPESQLFALNVEDEITFGLENLNLPWNQILARLEEALHTLNLNDLRHRSIEELSSGQKQKLALASVLVMKPKILLFDEPTANLDPKSVKDLIQTIKQLKKEHTILIVEHNINFLKEVSDEIVLMKEGTIISKGKTNIILQSKKYTELMEPPKQKIIDIKKITTETQNPTILEIQNLTYSYSNGLKALNNLNLTIGRGDFLGIIGTNGSGKSTLALSLIGLLKPKGKIKLNGRDITNSDVYERTRQIGYVFQNPNYQLFEETLDEELAFGPKNIEINTEEIKQRVKQTLQALHLQHVHSHDPHALSVGQKRRVGIGSILTMQPNILIIDEPDTGLDARTTYDMMRTIKELNKKGKTIILISHNMELIAKHCTRLIAMKNGTIVSPQEIYEEYLNSAKAEPNA